MVWGTNADMKWFSAEQSREAITQALASVEAGNAIVFVELIKGAVEQYTPGAKAIVDLRIDPSSMNTPNLIAIAAAACEVAQRGNPELRQFHFMHSSEPVFIYFEPMRRPIPVVILGAGHVGRVVAQLARMVGFKTVVVDERPEFANTGWIPDADEIHVGDFIEQIEQIPEEMLSFWLIMTSGHRRDGECLAACLRKPHAYIGMLSSPKKKAALFARLKEQGFTDAALNTIHTPVGLSIGAQTLEEIAISIVAEMIQVRHMLMRTMFQHEEV